MEEILRKLSIAFAAGALGGAARFAALGAVDATDLAAGYLPPLGWFLTANYVFKQIALGSLLGLALALPLFTRYPILRGLILAVGLTALMLLSADLGAPERLTAIDEAAWAALRQKIAPIAGVSGLIWGSVAALFYGAATKPEVHDAIDWEEEEQTLQEGEAVRRQQAAMHQRQEAMRRQQDPIALEHQPVPESETAAPLEPILIPVPSPSADRSK